MVSSSMTIATLRLASVVAKARRSVELISGYSKVDGRHSQHNVFLQQPIRSTDSKCLTAQRAPWSGVYTLEQRCLTMFVRKLAKVRHQLRSQKLYRSGLVELIGGDTYKNGVTQPVVDDVE